MSGHKHVDDLSDLPLQKTTHTHTPQTTPPKKKNNTKCVV